MLHLIRNICWGSWQGKQLRMCHIFASPALNAVKSIFRLSQTITKFCAWIICFGFFNLLLPNVPWPLVFMKGYWRTSSLKLLVFICSDVIGTSFHGTVFPRTHNGYMSRISVLWVIMIPLSQFIIHLLHKYLLSIYYKVCITLYIFWRSNRCCDPCNSSCFSLF